jgi:hypothetical protein
MQVEDDPGTGEQATGYVLLADLGEAAAVDATFPQKFMSSRINKDSVREYEESDSQRQDHGTASDILDWGQLAIEVIRNSHFALLWEDNQIRFPKVLMSILESCLDPDPNKRPSAKDLTRTLRNLTLEIWVADKFPVEWILGDYQLPKVAKRLSVSLQMSSEWNLS